MCACPSPGSPTGFRPNVSIWLISFHIHSEFSLTLSASHVQAVGVGRVVGSCGACPSCEGHREQHCERVRGLSRHIAVSRSPQPHPTSDCRCLAKKGQACSTLFLIYMSPLFGGAKFVDWQLTALKISKRTPSGASLAVLCPTVR